VAVEEEPVKMGSSLILAVLCFVAHYGCSISKIALAPSASLADLNHRIGTVFDSEKYLCYAVCKIRDGAIIAIVTQYFSKLVKCII